MISHVAMSLYSMTELILESMSNVVHDHVISEFFLYNKAWVPGVLVSLTNVQHGMV